MKELGDEYIAEDKAGVQRRLGDLVSRLPIVGQSEPEPDTDESPRRPQGESMDSEGKGPTK